MTDRAALIALRDAVEAGEFDPARFKGGPIIWRFNAFMDKAEPAFEGSSQQNTAFAWEAYKDSVDAAIAMIAAIEPIALVTLSFDENGTGAVVRFGDFVGDSSEKIPSRALLLAFLDALIEKERANA